ncbi:capsule assembly Wzi family protein [bacterium]|nr:capsule assembly Wzi family protein [bacterium]MBU1984315.1 capsule assembly Wzi family protein [bacterium]
MPSPRLPHLIAAWLFCLMTGYGLSEGAENDRLPLPFPMTSHPVYSYVSRLETLGDVPLQSCTRPYLHLVRHPARLSSGFTANREFRRFLGEADANEYVITRRDSPPDSPWRSLRRRAGLGEDQMHWLYGSGYHLASWTYDNTFAASVQPVYGYESISTDDERGTIGRFAGGIRVQGGYAQRVQFMMDFRDHTESGNGPYWERNDLYEDRWAAVDLSGESATTYNTSESFLQYYGGDLSITAGRGRHRWGPGQFGSLLLNSSGPPFDYVRFDAALETERSRHAVYYTFLHGWLESQLPTDTLYTNPDGRPRTVNAQKYLSAQRLEVRPRENVLLGFSQGVIYGDRGLQLGYLTPLNFLYSVQHSNDDKDNFVLTFDGTWRPTNGFKLYGEFLLDDVVVGELFQPTGSNKSAYTVGTQVAVPRPFWRNFDATLEHTNIRPFVYSHFFAVNTYTHWTSPLGYTLEPNSEFLNAALRGTFYPVTITIKVSRQNHGANPSDSVNVGGDIYAANYKGNDREYPFLDGRFEQTTRVGIDASLEILPGLGVYGGIAWIDESNSDARTESRLGFGWNP